MGIINICVSLIVAYKEYAFYVKSTVLRTDSLENVSGSHFSMRLTFYTFNYISYIFVPLCMSLYFLLYSILRELKEI